MIIACPTCSGPYQLPTDQIAPLVQVACPHCEHRVILDFEAANDPKLVEPGHGKTVGFDNEHDYAVAQQRFQAWRAAQRARAEQLAGAALGRGEG